TRLIRGRGVSAARRSSNSIGSNNPSPTRPPRQRPFTRERGAQSHTVRCALVCPKPYFMDTHDRSKGSWPSDDISEAEFIRIYAEFGQAVAEQGGHDLGAHVNVKVSRLLLHLRSRRGRDPARAREATLSVRLDHRGPSSHRRRSAAGGREGVAPGGPALAPMHGERGPSPARACHPSPATSE